MRNLTYFVITAMIFGAVLTSCNKDNDIMKEFTVNFETGNGGSIVAMQKKSNQAK